jgi:hypothetical protein
MFAGIAFTVVVSIPALVREIRLARRLDHPLAIRGFVLVSGFIGAGRWKSALSSTAPKRGEIAVSRYCAAPVHVE